MALFKNVFEKLSPSAKVDFRVLAETRRAKMVQEGFNVNCINWEHYVRVLEAKHEAYRKG